MFKVDNVRDARGIIYAAFVKDIPRAFLFHTSNYTFLSGPYGETLKYFARYKHLELQIRLIEEFQNVYDDINSGIYNMTTYSDAYIEPTKNLRHSYPVEWMKKCVVVPRGDEIPKFRYIHWPYQYYLWLTIFLGSIYIGVLMRHITGSSSPNRATYSYLRNIPHALNISLHSPNMRIHATNAPWRVQLFYALLLLYGFILSAYYVPYVTTYCTKPIFLPPINTMQDILDAKLTLLITKSDFYELEKHKDINLMYLKSSLRPMIAREIRELAGTFNLSYGYILSSDQWEFLSRQQQYLKKPHFHLTNFCFNAVLRSFVTQRGGVFEFEFDDFLKRVQQSGLWKQWVEKAFDRAVASGNAEIYLDTYPVEPLNLEFFKIAWIVLFTGLAIGGVVAIFEILLWKYQERKRK